MLIFTVVATNVTPASVTIPQTGIGFHTFECVPPVGHTWTEYDAEGINSILRPLDYIEKFDRPYPFQVGTTILRILHDAASGTYTVILK